MHAPVIVALHNFYPAICAGFLTVSMLSERAQQDLYVCCAVVCVSAYAVGARFPYTCPKQKVSIN